MADHHLPYPERTVDGVAKGITRWVEEWHYGRVATELNAIKEALATQRCPS